MSGTRVFRLWKMVILIMLLIVAFGCTQRYVPKQYPIRPDMVPEFRGSQTVTIINAQASSEEVLIGSQGMYKWMADLQKWTDTAVGLLKTELEKRGIPVTAGAHKELRLAITRANLFWGAATIRCILYLNVETGDGYTREFQGNNASGWTLYRACDGAVTRAVTAMLNDDKILGYLK